jgi:hypothetical protein
VWERDLCNTAIILKNSNNFFLHTKNVLTFGRDVWKKVN